MGFIIDILQWAGLAIAILFVLAFMIMTHESGHFWVAKLVGIRPKTFSLGFGPELVGWDRNRTRYAIKWIPAGGSVQILGMDPDEEISEEDWPESYYAAAPWRRAAVIIAGSAVHIVIAFILFWVIYCPVGYLAITGEIKKVSPTIKLSDGEVLDSPAHAAGLEKGDLIREIDGVTVKNWNDITHELQRRPGETVTIRYERGGGSGETVATLLDIDGTGILGITADEKSTYVVRSGPVAAIGDAAREFRNVARATFDGFRKLFSRDTLDVLLGTKQRNTESPQSIVGATRLAVEAADQGAAVFLYVIAYLFFFLAIFNLVPIPPFDGGHLIVVIVEKLTGKRIDPRSLVPIAWVVIVLLSLVALRLAILDVVEPIDIPW